jgi:ATP-dependent RNA helicase DDX19/DBP5
MEEKKMDDNYTVASTTGSDDTNNNITDESEEAIAKRLREKIRSQAEDLLSRVDSIREKRQSNNGGSNTNNGNIGRSHSSTPDLHYGTTTTLDNNIGNSSSSSSPHSGSSYLACSSESLQLTKRLQELAAQRAHTTKAENAERLRLIQQQSTTNNNGGVVGNNNPHHQHHLTSAQTFQELNLPSFLLDAIYTMGFDRPSAIQAQSLPIILQGRNLMGQAQSGSGKTAAFTIGMLHCINVNLKSVQAICVVPTRELAIQIVESTIIPMSQFMDQSQFTTQLAISQQQMDKGTKKITAQIVVGTPGKVVDWLKRKYIDVTTVKVLVLDEADAMVETHRANSILIRKHMPTNIQCLLFSATFPASTLDFASKILLKNNMDCDRILIDSEDLVLNVIKQVWIDTRLCPYTKLEFLADIYSILTIAQSIVFVNTKSDADRVYTTLSHSGYTCSVIHSGIDDRDSVMEQFRHGKSNVLISTNVLARGVDVDAVCLVINYDVRTYDYRYFNMHMLVVMLLGCCCCWVVHTW